MTRLLRTLAIAIAMAAFIDPAIARRRPAPLAVSIHAEPGNPHAERVKHRLIEAVGREIDTNPAADAAAAIVIGDRVDFESLPAGVPVSAVILGGPPNVRVAAVANIPAALPGRSVVVSADIESAGFAGETSVIVVEEAGIEVARLDQKWTADGRVHVRIPYVPSKAGVSAVRLVARPIGRETRQDDNAVDLQVSVVDRPLRVAVYEPRPSWSAGFVRRALEGDPSFSVSSLARISRDVEARAGEPPTSLTAEQLERFDVAIVGAPEDLRPADVEALRAYARVRGGSVVLLPDRRPSGAFVSMVPSAGFDEALLERPATIGPLQAGELALPRQPWPGWSALAAMPRPSGRPAILWWPTGDGRIVYSGALDAWRYRGRAEDSFARFWRDAIGDAALAAPPRISVSLSPSIARPGDSVRVRLRLRHTEFATPPGLPVELPSVTAEALGAGAGRDRIRLWPTAETGVFEGTHRAGARGRYDVRATAGAVLTADAVLTVDSSVARAPAETRVPLATMVAATGGVASGESDLSAVAEHLRQRPAPAIPSTTHPMRSAGWIVPFAGLLCAEWAVRRRQGRK